MTDCVLCLTTAGDTDSANTIAQGLLESRAAACVTLLPAAQSHYWWQGAIASATEVVLLIKSTQQRVHDIRQYLVEHHPYETPELLVFRVADGLENYLRWVENETRP